MSILSMMPNTCNLVEMVPTPDANGGNNPVPTPRASGLQCSVQDASSGTSMAYDAQNRIGGSVMVYFPQDIGIVANKSYRLTWVDANNQLMRVEGYREGTLGYYLVWVASCTLILPGV